MLTVYRAGSKSDSLRPRRTSWVMPKGAVNRLRQPRRIDLACSSIQVASSHGYNDEAAELEHGADGAQHQ
jgi:hypothetical protein